jgi:uncharacterized protein (TIGR02145 family)
MGGWGQVFDFQIIYMHMIYSRLNIFLLTVTLVLLLGCQSSDLIRDIDGNSYRTVQIGDQIWMTQNLRTTRFNDGTPIANVTGYEEWSALKTPAYCWYNNDSTLSDPYGALYNWYVVETDKLCPDGWHIPTDEEWNQLTSSIDILSLTGGALKESGMDHWRSPNEGATNRSGFSALPGGYRSYNGTFNLLRASAYWWSTTESNWYGVSEDAPSRVIFRSVMHDNSEVVRHISEKTNGFSVRCLKNQ